MTWHETDTLFGSRRNIGWDRNRHTIKQIRPLTSTKNRSDRFLRFPSFYQGPKSPEASFLGQEKVEAIHQTMYWWMDWHPSPQALPLSFAILALDTFGLILWFSPESMPRDFHLTLSSFPLFVPDYVPIQGRAGSESPPPSSQVALATIRVSRAATATTILAREATTIQPLD